MSQIPQVLTETPARRTFRQWFQMKICERLLQAANMAEDRKTIRRGARKMQDGTLGQTGGAQAGEEEMQIRVGDEVHYHTEASTTSAPQKSLAAKAAPYLLAAALGAGGGASALLPWLLSKKPEEPPAVTDTDTTRRIEVEVWRPGTE